MSSKDKREKIHLLLVEDDGDCRMTIKTLLDIEGFDVLIASDAEQALDILRQNKIDIVVTDIKLPGIDGIALLKHIRKYYRELPVILITGHGTVDSAINALHLGANDYITKPIGEGIALIASARNAVQHHRLTTQNIMLQKQLLHSEETFRQLFHNANDAIYLFGLDADGTIHNFSEVNNVACELMEYSREELLHMSILDIAAHEHRENIQNNILTLLETDSNTVETLLTTRNGQTIPVELKSRHFKSNDKTMIIARARDISFQRDMEQKLTNTIENERQQLGQELHDLVCQDLASIAMLASVIPDQPDAKVINELAIKSVRFVRGICSGLFPCEIENEGLAIALKQLAENQKNFTNIPCAFSEIGNINVPDKVMALNIYRIAQESTNNAIKHSQAKHISIRLEGHTEGGTLSITDDGKGMLDANTTSTSGMGLRIMKYRARMIGAVLQIDSSATKGTRITCSWHQKL